MYLVAEEVIRGNCHNQTNAFQWNNVMLNFPGTREYNPLKAWITKLRAENSLVSNFVCFVDNQQVTGHGRQQVKEAGHTISTRESYPGLQNTLQKVQVPEGSRTPGAWAGANVSMERDVRVVLLTSQEKWDGLKSICSKWLKCLCQGAMELDYKELQADQGFMVYVTQAYPGMGQRKG
jgi:hypothetical protein